ncbi:AlpA family transcriptional regulator [Endozoicomonas sp. SESOKO3]|nr:hypothetical protein [Endozoicomonas sp. SESOKO3]
MNSIYQPYQSHRERVNKDETAKKYLTRSELLQRYNIGNTTLYRWLNSKEIGFPSPTYFSVKTPRWKVSELEEWELKCQEEGAK